MEPVRTTTTTDFRSRVDTRFLSTPKPAADTTQSAASTPPTTPATLSTTPFVRYLKPKSRAGWIAAGVGVVGLAGLGWFFFRR